MAINEACQLWIEQRLEEELEDKKGSGKSLRMIGRELAKEIERIFEARVKPETLSMKASRMNQGVTNVTEESKDPVNIESTYLKPQIESGPELLEKPFLSGRGGTRKDAGRKPKEYNKIETEFFGTMEGSESFCRAFESFYTQVQNAQLEKWQITPKRSATYCIKLITDLIGEQYNV